MLKQHQFRRSGAGLYFLKKIQISCNEMHYAATSSPPSEPVKFIRIAQQHHADAERLPGAVQAGRERKHPARSAVCRGSTLSDYCRVWLADNCRRPSIRRFARDAKSRIAPRVLVFW